VTAGSRGAQRGTAREREGAFGYAIITAEVRFSLVTKHYSGTGRDAVGIVEYSVGAAGK
jgi:hypothetical protein